MSKSQIKKYTFDGEETDVLFLIYQQTDEQGGELYVYVDPEIDLEWGCNNAFSKALDVDPLKTNIRRVSNEIALLEPIAHNWPPDLKLAAKRLLGEAIVSATLGDEVGAAGAIAKAKNFLKLKSKQVSRFWTLKACLLTGAAALVLGALDVIFRNQIIGGIGRMPFLLSICFCAGCVGAVLFVVLKFGKQPNADSTAEQHLHYLEGAARIVGGGIAGVLVGGMVKLGLILPIFSQAGMESLAMCLAAMVAGASERLAAGIITKVENHEPLQPENPNANH
jgi:hypothetical protein